jgi:vancomycin resistance protein VanJ
VGAVAARQPSLAVRFARRMIALAGWMALAAALTAWALLRAADEWGPATFLMFGPRWLFVLPPALLLLPALFFRRRSLAPISAALVVALWPVMGFNVPWSSTGSVPADGPRLRVLTCNMHYVEGNANSLSDLMETCRADVIALQEWPEEIQSNSLFGDDWHVHNEESLFLASRYPIRQAVLLGDDSTGEHGSVALYELETPAGRVSIFSLHLASPRADLKGAVRAGPEGLAAVEANTAVRERQLTFIAGEAGRISGPLLLVGDFNTPPESVLFRRTWKGYANAFGEAGWGWGYTFANRWTRVRIDHVLVGGNGQVSACWVGPNVGSPHKPVIANVCWPAIRTENSTAR